VGASARLEVAPVHAYDLLARLHMDRVERAVASLGANALNTRLVFIKVNIGDHVAKLDSCYDVVAPVVPILDIKERISAQNNRRHLLVDQGRKEWALRIVCDQFNRCNYAKRILLVSNFFQFELLSARDSFENCSIGPLKIICGFFVCVYLEHGQLPN